MPRQKINLKRLKLLMTEPGVEVVTLKKRSKTLRYFHFHYQSLPPPHPASCLLRLLGGWRPPTWALCKLKASFPKSWEFQVALANKHRPDCFSHDLQPGPSPTTPAPNLRWWKITMPSRPALWKRARLEGNKGQPNQETHHWISPNHMDLKTCQTGLKLANTQENLLNATVMIHRDSLQF